MDELYDTDPLTNPEAYLRHVAESIFQPRQTFVDTRYIFYVHRREAGVPAETLVGVFPQAESFERMYQAGER